MSSVEENFPRGGTQKKGQEEKAVRQPTVDDNLFKVCKLGTFKFYCLRVLIPPNYSSFVTDINCLIP